MRCAIGAGTRPGRQQGRIDKRLAPSVGASAVSSAWFAPVGPSSTRRGCSSGRIRWSRRLPNLWLRPVERHALRVLALAIPGASPFSDGPLLPLLFQELSMQKNEPHPITRADGSILKSSYDGDGNLFTQTDGLGNSTSYTYDPLNRVISVTDPLGRTTNYGYDRTGNRTSLTDAAGQVTTYKYDKVNQLVSITYSDGKTPSVSFTYDANGQRTNMTDGTGKTTYTYDSLNRLIKSTNGAGNRVAYKYDLNGQLIGLTYPGGMKVMRSYDAAGQ